MLKKSTIILFLIFALILVGGCSSDNSGTNTLTVTQEGEGNVFTEKNNQTVNLIPLAEKGWIFDSWQGENGSEVKFNYDSKKYEIDLSVDKIVKAVFVREKYNLNITYEGEGYIAKEKLATISNSSYENGSKVKITAHADDGWVFSSWKGDIKSNRNPEEILIDGEKNITVVFKKAPSLSGNITVDYDFTSVKTNTETNFVSDQKIKINNSSNGVRNNSNEIIIAFHDNLTSSEKQNIVKDINGQIVKFIEPLNAAVVKVEDVDNQMMTVQSLKGVRYTEPNYLVQAHGVKTPNDSLYSSQWNQHIIDSPFSWFQLTGSSKIRVAVLDTGVDYKHNDLDGRIDYVNGYNFVSNNTDSSDDNGHGTHVTGIIGATTDNNIGIAGTTWKGEILPLKALDKNGGGSYSNIADAVLYAAGLSEKPSNPEPVDIINMSLGGSSDSTLLHDAIKQARKEGIIMVVSSGNNNENTLSYPARYPETIAVGAVNNTGERSSYSNYGPNLDLVAPGGSEYYGVLSTTPNDEYTSLAGTSMAAPHVSGLISLMLANGISERNIRNILNETSVHPGQREFSEKYGYGLINTNFSINEVNKVKVVLGNRENNKINKVAETTVSLDGGSYYFPEVPTGSYHLYAWIDISEDGIINEGDYIKEGDSIELKGGTQYQKDLILTID